MSRASSSSMIASSSRIRRPATPQMVLEALVDHLEPTALFKTLPSALNLFAHLQLISRKIIQQASEALKLQQAIEEMWESQKTRDIDSLGGLGERVVKTLEKLVARDEGDMMFGFSLELRRRHIAKLLTTPRLAPCKARPLIDCYFPALSVPEERANHKMLYIKVMKDEQLAPYHVFRQQVMTWYSGAERAFEATVVPPSIPQENIDAVVKKIMRYARKTIEDADVLESMFNTTSTSISQHERGAHVIVADPSPRSASLNAEPSVRRHSFAATRHLPITPVSNPFKANRPRPSLPVHSRPRSISPPLIQQLASVRRISFDTSARGCGRSSRIGSPAASSPTAFHHDQSRANHQLIRSSARGSSPLVPHTDRQSTPKASHHEEPDFEIEGYHGPASELHRDQPKASTSSHTPRQASSPVIKKRPRTSHSGLPPLSGPDYTTSLSSLTKTRSKEKLRPFEDDQLIRANKRSRTSMQADENSPRPRLDERPIREAETRETLGDGGSQENSQGTSQEYVPVKKDKGKGRMYPRNT